MKLIITSDTVYNTFLNTRTDLSLINDRSTLESILCERDRIELWYVANRLSDYIESTKNPLTDTLRMLENISISSNTDSDKSVVAVTDTDTWFDQSLKEKFTSNAVSAGHPSILQVVPVGNNTIVLIVATTKADDNYIGNVVYCPSLAYLSNRMVGKQILLHFMNIKGINEGLKTSLKAFLISHP